jgi:hypothetical protein
LGRGDRVMIADTPTARYRLAAEVVVVDNAVGARNHFQEIGR